MLCCVLISPFLFLTQKNVLFPINLAQHCTPPPAPCLGQKFSPFHFSWKSNTTTSLPPKVGAILKKSVDWSDTDVILSEESIDKAIVSLQIPEVFNDEAMQVLLWKNFWIGKAIVLFQTPEFLKVKRYRYFYAEKFWIVKAIVSFQTPEFLKMKRYRYFYAQKIESSKRLYRFKPQNLLAMKRFNYF